MGETKLTEKEELFCQGIIEGLGTVGAYRRAYSEKAAESTAFTAASQILKREKVSRRLEELRKPLEDAIRAENVQARDQQIKFILGRIELCKASGDENAIIRYTDMLNKIYGVYKENTGENIGENKLSALDTDVLRRLTASGSGAAG